MTFFFTIRIVFYIHMVFHELPHAILYRHDAFFGHYTPFKLYLTYFAMFLYVVLFLLNIVWYAKMIKGALKVLGVGGGGGEKKGKVDGKVKE